MGSEVIDRKIWAQLQKNDLLSEQTYQSWVDAWVEAWMVDRKTEVILVGAIRARQLPGLSQRPSPSLENSSFPLQTKLSDLLACQWGGVYLLGVVFAALQAYSVKCKGNFRAGGPALLLRSEGLGLVLGASPALWLD